MLVTAVVNLHWSNRDILYSIYQAGVIKDIRYVRSCWLRRLCFAIKLTSGPKDGRSGRESGKLKLLYSSIFEA